MKRPTKFLLLFIALLLPALVYVFLKSFGRNEFDVQPLYQEEVKVPKGCEYYTYAAPYVVPDSVLVNLGWSPGTVNLFVLDADWRKAGLRLLAEFPGMGFAVNEVPVEKRASATCALLLQRPANAAMVDTKGRIRGQYDLGNREDYDRLIVEMKIMMVKY